MTDESHDLIGAYALDALDAAERAAFEQHLAECEACQVELIGLRETLDDLADDTAVEPPPALRDAVLGAVAALPLRTATEEGRSAADDDTAAEPGAGAVQSAAAVDAAARRTFVEHDRFTDPEDESSPAVDEAELPARPRVAASGGADEAIPRRARDLTHESSESDTAAPESSADEPADPIATVTPLRPRRAQSSRWALLVAAAVALIAVIGVSVWQPWAPRTITAADVLAASDAVRVSEPVKGGGTVTVVRSAQLGRAVMTTVGVPDAPSGKVRQAWLKVPTGMVSAGLLPPGTDVSMLLEGDARTAEGAGLSIEPAGGATSPGDDVRALFVL
ncbi:MAG: anti-sigma factor [Micropruina glycogenica]